MIGTDSIFRLCLCIRSVTWTSVTYSPSFLSDVLSLLFSFHFDTFIKTTFSSVSCLTYQRKLFRMPIKSDVYLYLLLLLLPFKNLMSYTKTYLLLCNKSKTYFVGIVSCTQYNLQHILVVDNFMLYLIVNLTLFFIDEFFSDYFFPCPFIHKLYNKILCNPRSTVLIITSLQLTKHRWTF